MVSHQPFHVLVFSKTSSYRHDSISAGISSIQALAQRTELFTVDASEDSEIMKTSSLRRYCVIIFLQCTGTFLSPENLDALKGFVGTGGGIIGIHGAAAGMLENEWYGNVLGAHFDSHPKPEKGRVVVEDKNHWITAHSNSCDGWMDEWYNFRTHPSSQKGLKVLLKGDTKSFTGGKMGEDHPLSWCQELEHGRSFYTALGHFQEAFTDDWFMKQIFRAILWVANRETAFDAAFVVKE